jgi:hypothetical protein
MKITPSKVSISVLAFILTLVPLYTAHAQNAANEFHHRMNVVYRQANSDTLLQQVIFGSLEVFATYKIGSFIHSPDRREISAIALQIKGLESFRNSSLVQTEIQIPERERRARIAQLNRRLRVLEGSIGERMARGTAKFFVRGAQLLLVLDLGSRIYVLTALDHKDPGTIPLKTLFCSEVDCQAVVYELMGLSRNVDR